MNRCIAMVGPSRCGGGALDGIKLCRVHANEKRYRILAVADELLAAILLDIQNQRVKS